MVNRVKTRKLVLSDLFKKFVEGDKTWYIPIRKLYHFNEESSDDCCMQYQSRAW